MKSALKLLDMAEKEISIQAPWGKMAALSWGAPSDPPVLLCHGKTDVCSSFRPLVALLPRAFHYVSLECPGNGRSDPFPANARFSTVDYVPAVLAVKEHFRWDRFIYIGHSQGVITGKYFNFAYPGVIRRMVELDPVPAYEVWTPENFGGWYHMFYGDFYKPERYKKINGSIDTAPKYTYEKAHEMLVNVRGLTAAGAAHVLERALVPAPAGAGAGLYRLTFDQRQKEIPRLPLSAEQLQQLYTSVRTPTLLVLAQGMVELRAYERAACARDPAAWPHRNARVLVVPGGHDAHLNTPEAMADDIGQFLLDEFKAKL